MFFLFLFEAKYSIKSLYYIEENSELSENKIPKQTKNSSWLLFHLFFVCLFFLIFAFNEERTKEQKNKQMQLHDSIWKNH